MLRRSLFLGLAFVLATAGMAGARPSPAWAGEGPRWRSVAVGGNHTCGIQWDWSLWCWGSNSHGQLGLGDTTDRPLPTLVPSRWAWKQVTVGQRHTCARYDRSLHCWGANEHGQLGLGSTTPALRPIVVPGDWSSVATSYSHTCATAYTSVGAPAGALWCWGWNGEGQLGTGDRASASTPRLVDENRWRTVRTGYAHTCGLHADQRLFCWGRGDHGQIGVGDTADRLRPRIVGHPILDQYQDVAVGADHTCGLRWDWSLWCWGRNHQGQLGVGSYATLTAPAVVPVPPLDPPVGDDAYRLISTQDSHTCALAQPSGTNWCWGANSFGQLGNATAVRAASPVRSWIVDGLVVAGMAHTCAIRFDESLWCWGKNGNGQLGLGDTANRLVPTPISLVA